MPLPTLQSLTFRTQQPTKMSYVAKDNISFDPENMYSNSRAKRQSLINKVHAYKGPSGAVYAVIVYVSCQHPPKKTLISFKFTSKSEC